MALFDVATQASNKAPSLAPLLEAAGYPARVCRIIDLGKQPGSAQYPEPQYKMRVTFELLDEFMKETLEDGTLVMVQDPDEEEGVMMAKNLEDKPRWFDFDFTYNADGFMGDNSHIARFMKAVDALEVKPNLEQGIQGHPAKPLNTLLGEPLVVGIVTYTKSAKSKNAGQIANKIATFSAMKSKDKKAAKPLVNPTLFFNLGAPDLEAFNKLQGGDSPYAVKNLILNNLDFDGSELQKLLGGTPSQQPATNTATPEQVDAALQAELEAQRLAREAASAQNAEGKGDLPF
ncbi:TPA: hypothetical protein SIF59_004274 [Escherichia coli]|nr:hypothetical protein [Escherichia coli]